MKALLRQALVTLLLTATIFFLLQSTVQSFIVVGYSMEPSLHQGQRLLVNKAASFLGEPERGDIIVFHPPDNGRADYIKRVIGLPGESVEIKDGMVYIHKDGQVLALEEPYVKEHPRDNFEGGIIPDGEYFLLGDNRNNSSDSRRGWLVPRRNIIGKAWLSLWPPSEWGLAPNHPLPQQPATG
ncbi:MAG: signal peptidase I [Chloroflexi bacterium]|nr:signal peptidase I [Chloroflexota bacterium]